MVRPIARVLGLLEILQMGGSHQLAGLSDTLGVDQRTVRRYIDYLLDLGIPVESTRGRYGGYRLAAGFRLPPLMLTDDEALAVLIGLHGDEGGASATAKILRVLPEASRARFEALLRVSKVTGSTRNVDAVPDTDTLLTVAEAAGAHRPLLVSYADREGRGSRRVLLPYGLVARSGRWYLSAADSLSGEVRTFRIDRIRSVEPQEGSFVVPADLAALDPPSAVPWRYAVSVRVESSAAHVLSRFPEGLATVTELPRAPGGPPTFEPWARVELRAQRLDWVPALLAGLDRPFIVDEPAKLRDHVRRLGERLVQTAGADEIARD
ncbi:WYL domain-containing protein [soil metagenome]